ncbi:fatty acid synthase-like isoform X1 [Vanessa atalanta]|uniref:fatty acid synthase-like isoform X1 n=1 Tax=Vanessa atalanta TaxID=42275 RepID=UPI001FCCF8E8|nr:fatty acid synthase-like isoform X1 [Vanessa atalanta]
MAPITRTFAAPPNFDQNGLDGEKVVISGMAGLYPESHNVKDLSKILYNKENPVNADNTRWHYDHPEVANFNGKVPELRLFDAQFFKVHYRLGNNMDPMGRKILEQAYQAIYDAGISPAELNGKKVGVYIGSCFSETEKACFYVSSSRTGFGIAGCSKTMFANRISYWLNAKGPSMAIDEACSSSTGALELAYLAIIRGECEAAIVGGANLCLHPQSSVHYGRIMQMCMDGKTKSFDSNAAGCAKSEAINVLFLQKAKNALRVYAEVVHVKCEFTSILKDERGSSRYGFYRNPSDTANFIKRFYEEAKISPEAVEYVEAFGSAVSEADKSELEAIEQAYCQNRNQPLLVGSVMSNIGYGEAASGISSITKVLLGYHTGKLAGNLHCDSPRQDVAALRDGKIKIITDHQNFSRQYTAVNGMSVTGVNTHVLLHGHYKPKDPTRYKSSIPQLVTLSGRQESSVRKIIDDLKSRPIDPEELALFRNIHKTSIFGHLGRGYTILDTKENNETVSLAEKTDYFDDAKRPLWFVYSGMGSQWAGMGTQLMRIPIFAASIERCRRALEPKGIDIVHIITSPDKTIFDNILHSFVGIAAIQIGLTDILSELGIFPDKIIGHSVGELGCAYADGCFTAEEMILAAYSRGLVSLQTPFIKGSMAAVGIGYQRISKMCPPEIQVACHNGPDSSTISGPANVMREFVAHLTSKDIFAKEVPCSNIAYHSRYIAEAGPGLLKYLTEVIKSPKPRSERWVSTSVPQDRWDEPIAKYSSAEYHTNNLLNSVLFEEASVLIPPNAVLVEIAPHGLLQAILKRSLPDSCRHIPLTRRGHQDNAQFLLEAIGKLYMEGYNPKVETLYPKIEYPVSTGTPMLSHLVEWAHTERWNLALYMAAHRKTAAACKNVISTHDDNNKYLKGHVIQDKNMYPFAAVLVAVWDTLAMVSGVERKQLSVEFREVQQHSQMPLHNQRQLRINVALHRGTGRFEVLSMKIKIATGYIVGEIKDEKPKDDVTSNEPMTLESDDIYQLLYTKGYNYSDEFKSIYNANMSLTEANIIWRDNWVTFIDGIIQLNTLRRTYETVSQLYSISKMVINVSKHLEKAISINDNTVVIPANVNELHNYTRCGGVTIENIRFFDLPPKVNKNVALKSVQKNKVGVIEDGQYYLPLRENRDMTLEIKRQGDLDSLHWVDGSESNKDGVKVTVRYAGINDVDMKKKMGLVALDKDQTKTMLDFSGITESGARVMGIVYDKSIKTSVRVKPELLWPVPDHWSLEDAATVPLAYSVAFYCLIMKSKFKSGINLLVHGGAGALGQAVISIALAHGCQVFTTVSDTKKKQFLQRLFPELKGEHIGNSRDISFSDMVMSATKGLGCNIVISCVRGEIKNATMKCCHVSSTFIDAAVLLNREEFFFGMKYLTKSVSYCTLDLNSTVEHNLVDDLKQLQQMLSEGIARGYVRPLSRVTYAPQDVSRAYRLQAGSRHRGRVLINLQEDPSYVQTKISCSPNLYQIIVLENEVLGSHLVERLIKRGAKEIILISSNQSNCLSYKLRTWEKQGVNVQLLLKNVNTTNQNIFENIKTIGIEGIYYVASPDVQRDRNSLEQLMLLAQRSSSTLKFFAVIGNDNDNLIKTVADKNHEKLTLIKLPTLKKETNVGVKGTITVYDAIDAVEKALCSKQHVVFVDCVEEPPKTLLQQLSSLAGIQVPDDANSEATLQDFGIDPTNFGVIQVYMRDVCHISLDEREIQLLTIEKIRDLDEGLSDTVFKETDGLETFISYVDQDELLATTEMVFLPTLTNISAQRDDEFDVSQTYLCVVPGVEGHHARFQVLCERLKLPAIVLQPGLDSPHQTIQEMADRFAKILLKKKLSDGFYLVGYESGVLVALEMAAIFEEQGLTGTVYCIGGAPNAIQETFEEKLKNFKTEDELQDAVVRHMFKLMTNDENTERLDSVLQNSMTWNEKVSACVKMLSGHVVHSNQYTEENIKAAYGRIIQVRKCNMQPRRLRSKIVSMRPKSNKVGISSLQNYSMQPVVEYELEAPLAYAAQDLRGSAFINRHLDPAILEAFEKRNLCETYILNSDTFMSNHDDV